MGCILIILGMAFYFARGSVAALLLAVVGVALLAGGLVYPNRVKQKEPVMK